MAHYRISEKNSIEHEVSDTEQRYQAIVESQIDFICRWRPDGVVTFANKAFADLMRKNLEDVYGANVLQYLPVEQRVAVRSFIDSLNADNPIGMYEQHIVIPNNEDCWIQWTTQVVLDSHRRIVEYQSVGREITALKMLEQRLRENEHKFRLLYEEAPLGYCLLDETATILELNQAWSKLVGYSREEAVLKNFIDCISADSRTVFERILDGCSAEGFFGTFLCDLKRNDGTTLTCNCFGRGFSAPVSHRHLFHCMFNPVLENTARKNTRKNIAEQDDEYYALVENLTVGVYRNTVDSEGKFLFANKAIVGMFGYSSVAEFLGVRVTDLYYQAADRNGYLDEIKRYGFINNKELRLRRKDGTPFYAAVSARVRHDASGSIAWIDGIIEDISESKKIEIEIKQSREELQRQKNELEKKTLALTELLNHVEAEKQHIKAGVMSQLEREVFPTVEQLKRKGSSIDKKYISVLEQSLKQITLTYGQKVSQKLMRLSPREMEICSMIKNGLKNKEIAQLLNINVKTVETHRRGIRRKLNLVKRSVNLTVFLHNNLTV